MYRKGGGSKNRSVGQTQMLSMDKHNVQTYRINVPKANFFSSYISQDRLNESGKSKNRSYLEQKQKVVRTI